MNTYSTEKRAKRQRGVGRGEGEREKDRQRDRDRQKRGDGCQTANHIFSRCFSRQIFLCCGVFDPSVGVNTQRCLPLSVILLLSFSARAQLSPQPWLVVGVTAATTARRPTTKFPTGTGGKWLSFAECPSEHQHRHSDPTTVSHSSSFPTATPNTRNHDNKRWLLRPVFLTVQELCESRGGRPGLSVLTSLLVSVDVKLY